MSEVEKLVSALCTDLDSLTDPKLLLDHLGANLTALRGLYRRAPSEFAAEDVDFLASLKPFEDGLKWFLDYLSEEPTEIVRSQIPANRVAELDDIIQLLEPYKVARRAHTVRRTYGERVAKPRAEVLEKRKVVAQEMSRGASPCRCGRPMTVHVGDHVPFWGCTGYPHACSRIRRMTPEQMARFDAL